MTLGKWLLTDPARPLNPASFRRTMPQRQGERCLSNKNKGSNGDLAAIFAADVAGYSRLMSQDEAGTLRALAAAREVMDGLIRRAWRQDRQHGW